MKADKIVQEYKAPHKLTKELNEHYRDEKNNLADLRDKFTATVQYEMPRASKEKVEATVFRKLYEDQHIKKEPEDPELTLKPDLARTLAPFR